MKKRILSLLLCLLMFVSLFPAEAVWANTDQEAAEEVTETHEDPPKQEDPQAKPAPENPTPENPTPENPDPENPDPENPDPENPTPENPDPENPDPENPDPDQELDLADPKEKETEWVKGTLAKRGVTMTGSYPKGAALKVRGSTGFSAATLEKAMDEAREAGKTAFTRSASCAISLLVGKEAAGPKGAVTLRFPGVKLGAGDSIEILRTAKGESGTNIEQRGSRTVEVFSLANKNLTVNAAGVPSIRTAKLGTFTISVTFAVTEKAAPAEDAASDDPAAPAGDDASGVPSSDNDKPAGDAASDDPAAPAGGDASDVPSSDNGTPAGDGVNDVPSSSDDEPLLDENGNPINDEDNVPVCDEELLLDENGDPIDEQELDEDGEPAGESGNGSEGTTEKLSYKLTEPETSLSAIVAALGLEGEITGASSGNETLFTVAAGEDGAYVVKPLQNFSAATLTITAKVKETVAEQEGEESAATEIEKEKTYTVSLSYPAREDDAAYSYILTEKETKLSAIMRGLALDVSVISAGSKGSQFTVSKDEDGEDWTVSVKGDFEKQILSIETEDAEISVALSYSERPVENAAEKFSFTMKEDTARLSAILEEIGITGAVEKIVSYNGILCEVTPDEDGGDWTITARKYFSAAELKVRVDSIEYTIILNYKEPLVYYGSEEVPALRATAPNGAVVTVRGYMPEAVSVSIKDPAQDPDSFMAEGQEVLFAYDISIIRDGGEEFQPAADRPLSVSISMPTVSEALDDFKQVGVMHVADNASVGEVIASSADGDEVSFSAGSFSLYIVYSFTVDFHFNGKVFSISGYEEIRLSEIFGILGITDVNVAEDVASVVFSDPSLLEVRKLEDGDWMLRSLAPFRTFETLTVTMRDGTEIVIDVTDALLTNSYKETVSGIGSFEYTKFKTVKVFGQSRTLGVNNNITIKFFVNYKEVGSKNINLAAALGNFKLKLNSGLYYGGASQIRTWNMYRSYIPGVLVGDTTYMTVGGNTITFGLGSVGASTQTLELYFFTYAPSDAIEVDVTRYVNVVLVGQNSNAVPSVHFSVPSVGLDVDWTHFSNEKSINLPKNTYFYVTPNINPAYHFDLWIDADAISGTQGAGGSRMIYSQFGSGWRLESADINLPRIGGGEYTIHLWDGAVSSTPKIRAYYSGAGWSSAQLALFVSNNGYHINYEPNGATGGSTASQYIGKYLGIARIRENGFTWPGHTFNYWNTKPDGSGETYYPWTVANALDPSKKCVFPHALTDKRGNLTLYAIWDLPTYTYKTQHWLEQLDGSYKLEETVESSATEGNTVSAVPRSYTGFTLNESDPRTVKEGVVNDNSLVLKLYYTRNSYTVTYRYTGTVPADATTLPAPVDYKHGEIVTVAEKAVASGYIFKGWEIKTPASGTTIESGVFTMPTQEVVLEGHFEVAQFYHVHLDKQGGHGGTSDYWYVFDHTTPAPYFDMQYYYYTDANCTVGMHNPSLNTTSPTGPAYGEESTYDIVIPTREGYTFEGYFTQPNGQGTQYVAGTTVKREGDWVGECINNIYSHVKHDSTLYAYWIKNEDTVVIGEEMKKQINSLDPFADVTFTFTLKALGEDSVGNNVSGVPMPDTTSASVPFSYYECGEVTTPGYEGKTYAIKSFNFGALTFGPQHIGHTYYYTVEETANKANWENLTALSADEQRIVIRVENDGHGKAKVVPVQNGYQIVNWYHPTPITVETGGAANPFLVKTVTSESASFDSQTFNFSLKETGNKDIYLQPGTEKPRDSHYGVHGMPEGSTGGVKTASVTYPATAGGAKVGDQTVDFGAITYTHTGVYYYELKEDVTGLGDAWTVTPADGTLTFKVTIRDDNFDGVLEPEIETQHIINSYDADGVTVSTGVDTFLQKKVEANSLTYGEKTFEFGIAPVSPASAPKPEITQYDASTGTVTKVPIDSATLTFNNEATTRTVDFGSIKFTAEGTYTYKVWEKTPAAATGWTYDASGEHTITVSVVDNGFGKLEATVSGGNVVVTNTYEVEPIEINTPDAASAFLTKSIGASSGFGTATFTFTLTALDGAPMPEGTTGDSKNASVTFTDSALDDQHPDFGKIKYTEVGEYSYTVSEKTPLPSGWTSNGSPATVTVTVTDDNGKLKAEVTGATIENAYKSCVLDTTEVDFALKKVLTQIETMFGSKTFNFTLSAAEGTPMPEGAVVADGKASMTGAATILSDDLEGSLVAGSDPAEPEYTAPYSAASRIDFSKITFTEAGSYHYTVTEDAPGAGWSWLNDKSSVEITVKVTAAADGSLSASLEGTEDSRTITNVYALDPISVSAKGLAQKKVEVPDPSYTYSSAQSFEFVLLNLIEDKKIEKSLTFTAGETGTKEIPFADSDRLSFSAPGVYPIYVFENEPGGDWTTQYDKEAELYTTDGVLKGAVIYIKVKEVDGALVPVINSSEDFDSGTETEAFEKNAGGVYAMKSGIDPAATVTNKYIKKLVVNTIETDAEFVKKEITCKQDTFIGTAKFGMTIEAITPDAPLPTRQEAWVEFSADEYDTVTIKPADFGSIVYAEPGTYKYKVTEVADSLGSGWSAVNADGTLAAGDYTAEITVEITMGSDNELHAAVTGTTIKNQYRAITVPTAPTDATATPFLKKQVAIANPDNIYAEDMAFSFEIGSDDPYAPMPVDETGAAKTTGTVSFTPAEAGTGKAVDLGSLTFTEPVIYTYTITETTTLPDGWTKDKDSVTVTVTVEETSDGMLTATVAPDTTTGNVITNTYTAYAYTVEYYTVAADGTTVTKLTGVPYSGAPTGGSAPKGTAITVGTEDGKTVKVNASVTIDGTDYAYDKEMSTGVASISETEADNVVKVYYGIDEMPGPGPDPVPDYYQVTFKYVAGANGAIKSGATTEEVVTIFDNAGKWAKTGTVSYSGSEAEADDGYYFSKWAGEIAATSYDAAMAAGTKAVVGGTTYTQTAEFKKNPVSHMTLTKTSDQSAEVKLGDVITYTVTVKNDGDFDLANVKVTDTLSVAGAKVTWTELDGGTENADNSVTFASLAKDAEKTLKATYTVTEADILNGKVVNKVTASGNTVDPGVDPEDPNRPLPDPEVTPGEKEDPTEKPESRLKVTKTTTSTPKNGTAYLYGETISYEITVENTGNVTLTNIVVVDPLTEMRETIASLAPGATAPALTTEHVVTAAEAAAGKVLNTATIESATPPDPTNPDVTPDPVDPDDPEDVEPGSKEDVAAKKEITLTAASARRVYNGTPLNANAFTRKGALAKGDTIKVTVTGGRTTVGQVPNVVTAWVIKDADGNDVTEGYKVTKTDGWLIVDPAPLTITSFSDAKVYDGTPLTAGGSIVGLVNGETATITTTGSQTEVGESQNDFYVTWGTADPANYTITYARGFLTVYAPAAPEDPEPRDPEIIDEPPVPQAAPSAAWALLNLILAIVTLIGGVIMGAGYFGKNKDEEADAVKSAAEGEQEDENKKKGVWRILGALLGVAAIVTFFLTENMKNPMVFVDKWTILMAVYTIAQGVDTYVVKDKKKNGGEGDLTAEA